jgi:lysophospholipase L1-like esterase
MSIRLSHVLLIGVLVFGQGVGVSSASQPAGRPGLPTLFVIGDSTASNGPDLGWGSHLGSYFDPQRINVVNRAMAGRSSRSFQTEGRWDNVLAEMKAGDSVLIQFGHNDGGPINDTQRARGSLPGLGDETQEIDNLLTGKHEVVHTFGWYMRKFIADTRAKGATPIVLSLTVRNIWTAGKVERGSGRFSQWAGEMARAEDVAFVDVTNIVADEYERLGQDKVQAFFPKDHTHTSAEGADLNAALVVSGLKSLPNCPLASYLSSQGQNVKSYAEVVMTRAWMPEAQPTVDPKLPTLFLIGDSTVRTGSKGNGDNGQWGWGAPMGEFFDRGRINVLNRAWGGTSSRTFQTQGFWDKVLADLKPGDFVMMQFGHNDSSPVNDNQRARGTIKGVGNETQEIDNLLTGKHEVVHSYGWYLRKFIADAKAKGATAIVCSPIPRNNWRDGKVMRASNDYGKWAGEAAKALGAFFVDLNVVIADRYDKLGEEHVTATFFGPKERTHTGAAGAKFNAQCVVEGLKAIDGCPLTGYLRKDAQEREPAR